MQIKTIRHDLLFELEGDSLINLMINLSVGRGAVNAQICRDRNFYDVL